MISRLRGELVHKEIDRADVATPGGVTYELRIPAQVFEALPGLGADVELRVVLLGRDDGLDLYGFRSELERQLFLRLQSASGVGPRLALTLMSAMSAAQLVEAIRGRDLARLQTVSGVGKKKAERIAVELGDKFDDMIAASVESEPEASRVDAVVSALLTLGYARAEAEAAVRKVLRNRDGAEAGTERLVKEALAELA